MSSKTWITPTVKQAWVASSTLLNKIGSGMLHGLMSSILTAIKDPDSGIKMSIHTFSWFVGSVGIGGMLGLLISSILMSKSGRRIAFFTTCLPGVIGLILMASTANNIVLIFIGRICCGITIASANVVGAVVIGEYTAPEHRGWLLNSKNAGLNVGSLIVHVIGNYAHWRIVALISVLPFAMSLVISYTWPESPSWLAEKRNFRKSEEVFYWLRGKNKDSTREIKELIKSQRDKPITKTFSENLIAFLKKFKQKNFLKPLTIIIFAMFLSEASGRHLFPTYAPVLIKEITSNNANSFYYNVFIDILIIVSSITASILITILGIRKLLLSTGFASIVILNLACVTLYLVFKDIISNTYSYVPLCLFALFVFLVTMGCAPMPLVLLGEIFPLEHKSFGTSLAGYIDSFIITVMLKSLPYLIVTFGINGAFAILGIFIIVPLIVLYLMLPETKNRTLQEIEGFFEHGKFRDGDMIADDDQNFDDVSVRVNRTD